MYWHRTHKTSLGVKKTIRELMPCTVGAWRCGLGGSRKGVGLIKYSDFQRSLLARSTSDPSVLTTRGAYVLIFSLCCLLSVCNIFTTPRAGPQSWPLPLVYISLIFHVGMETSSWFMYCLIFIKTIGFLNLDHILVS